MVHYNWLVLSDEQMSKKLQFSLLNDEQMSNWVGVKHLPDKFVYILLCESLAEPGHQPKCMPIYVTGIQNMLYIYK